MLHVHEFGRGAPLVALHGFSLTGEQFAQVPTSFDRLVVAPDLPGHGGSATEPTDVHSVVEAVGSVVDSWGEPVPVVGYSQGARIALLVALARPASVSCLVLISGNAGIEDLEARQARVSADAELAEHIRAEGLSTFVDEWTATGLTSTAVLNERDRAEDRRIRMTNTAAGLAAALTGYGQGSQPVVWDRLEQLETPTLSVAGGADHKYTDIAARMSLALPRGEVFVVPDAGHNPLMSDPQTTTGRIRLFVDRNG